MTFKRIFTFFAVLAVLEVGGMVSAALWLHHGNGESSARAAESHIEAEKVRALRAADEGELFAHTAKLIGNSKNQLSVYFWRPDREVEPFIYNARQMSPASMIKLFIMAKAMQDVHDGRLSLAEKLTIRKNDVVGGAGVTTWYNTGEQRTILQLITVMITVSDNTATNMLINRLGMKNINDYLQQYGYYDTVLAHKMMISNDGKKNLSSVRDIGQLLSRLYYRQLVGPQEDEIMLDILRQQRDSECFPAALPDYKIAHKTGEVTGVYADGGILQGKDGDFILVLLSNGREGRGDTIATMQNLAKYYAGTMQE